MHISEKSFKDKLILKTVMIHTERRNSYTFVCMALPHYNSDNLSKLCIQGYKSAQFNFLCPRPFWSSGFVGLVHTLKTMNSKIPFGDNHRTESKTECCFEHKIWTHDLYLNHFCIYNWRHHKNKKTINKISTVWVSQLGLKEHV